MTPLDDWQAVCDAYHACNKNLSLDEWLKTIEAHDTLAETAMPRLLEAVKMYYLQDIDEMAANMMCGGSNHYNANRLATLEADDKLRTILEGKNDEDSR